MATQSEKQRQCLDFSLILQDKCRSAYQSDVALPPIAGVLSLTLPATTPPLELGTPYHWFFKLYCRPTSPPSAFVDGWIQREPLPSELAQQLATATLAQQTRIYAAQGFWHEALTTAATLRQRDSADATWTALLQAIGLEQLATETILTPQN